MPGINFTMKLVSRTMYRFIFLIVFLHSCSGSIDNLANKNEVKIKDNEIPTSTEALIDEYRNVSTTTTKDDIEYSNVTVTYGNILWDGLMNECQKNPSFSCIQKNVYSYLSSTLEFPGDYNVYDGLFLKKNRVDYTKYTKEANEEDIDDEEDEGRYAESPMEEVTEALYGKSVKFMMTHDVELKMPEMMFDGATFRISPRSIEGDGAIVKLEIIPKFEMEARGEDGLGRIFHKKIKQFFKNKLLLALFAIILVLKLIKLKLLFVLPALVGVATAKKFFLKFLLFLFPAFTHIFKLCSYYHANFHQTKYHHHQHHISHLHHTVPYVPAHDDHGPPEIIHTLPPGHPPHHPPHHGGGGHHHDYDTNDHIPEFLFSDVHRNSFINFKPKVDDLNDIHAWGLGGNHPKHPGIVNPFVGAMADGGPIRLAHPKIPQGPPVSPVYLHPHPQRLQPAASQIAAQYNPVAAIQVEKELQKAALIRAAQQQEALRLQNEQLRAAQALQQQKQQQLLLHQQQQQQQQSSHNIQAQIEQRPSAVPSSASQTYDPFYSPILTRLDRVFQQLGFGDEPCRERLVCSMYRNPSRFSPHSNLVSAELSRDSNELQKPQSPNGPVIRFYRYVQAARDGQDQKDCLRLYTQCAINTEN